ncbi:VOC family protein [Acinetobacter sp. C32I]|uniref:VOC family protein n=1 Tax=Acinetobacter sp. C32I TaxID=2950074 RepID=UPI00203760B7|nr:VOC family protein [Acinetobacter sp. C32I]USA52007.1 VOC family protein [Acinetobacter sp. C32I]
MADVVIPYLNVRNAFAALEFYKVAFGAEVLNIIERKEGLVAHADVSIEGARFMLREEYLEFNFKSPESIGGTPINLFVYVKDVKAFFERAQASGVKVIRPVEEQFHGDLMTELEDPFGHSWFFATHHTDMTFDELKEQARQVGL